MTNSTGIPPVHSSSIKPASNGQVVQIVSLPEGLQNVARATRIEGEVVQQNPDGSTRLQTSEGPVDVTFRGRQPQPGTRVELDLPPGAPPRQATARPAPSPLQQPASQVPAPPATTPSPSTLSPSPAPSVPVKPTQGAPQTQPLPSQAVTPPSSSTPVAPQTPAPAPPSTQGGYTQAATPVRHTPLPPLMIGQTLKVSPASVPDILSSLSKMTENFQPVIQTSTPSSSALTPNAILKPAMLLFAADSKFISISPSLPSAAPDPFFPDPISPRKNLISFGNIQPQAGLKLNPENPITQWISKFFAISSPSSETIIASLKSSNFNPSVGNLQLFKSGLAAPSILDNGISPSLATFKPASLSLSIQNILPSIVVTSPEKAMMPSPSLLYTPQVSPLDILTPQTMLGTVNGKTPQGALLFNIQTTNGTLPQSLILPAQSGTLANGSQLILHIQPSQSSVPSLPSQNYPLFEPSLIWPAMDDFLQTLSQFLPHSAQSMARVFPSPSNPGQFGPAVLFFIAAVKSGNLDGWMGDRRVELLSSRSKDALLSRLNMDGVTINRANADASASEWKTYPIPLMWQQEISKIILHTRQEAPDREDEDQNTGTRFILDLCLSRMGDVQLDGFVRGKRMDMVVRTQLPISSSMQDAMKKAYAAALINTDIYGDIGFQSDIKGWERVPQSAERKSILSA